MQCIRNAVPLLLLACILWPRPAAAGAYGLRAAAQLGFYAASGGDTPARPAPADYSRMRNAFFHYEESRMLGADIELNGRELQANQLIMALKLREYEEGLATPHLFKPSRHIFSVLQAIGESPLFQYLRAMPKGGALHTHDTALCSTDFLIALTYWQHLWWCEQPADALVLALRFAESRPQAVPRGHNCSWLLVEQVRQQRGAAAVDGYLRERLTLYPTEKFLDINAAWSEFTDIFFLVDDILTYAPAWAAYFQRAMEEFLADGVQYFEIRTTLPTLYDLKGSNYTALDTVRIYKDTLDKFMATHPDFIGVKLIYAPIRHVEPVHVEQYIRICIEIKEKYPDFIAGFDLVGQEELGRPLKDFIPQLLAMPSNIDFFFHAGETNFYGSSVDENLVDAVLLDTKRIGHGFALVKHPALLQLLKEKDIAIEVNPVSNQVLQLVADYRNHPCAQLFADNYTVVISSDDPSFWKAAPLSHDFYIAFLGIASAHSDLRLLKKLILNSLHYSAMDAAQKQVALMKWQVKWDDFIERVIQGEVNASNQRLLTNRID